MKVILAKNDCKESLFVYQKNVANFFVNIILKNL